MARHVSFMQITLQLDQTLTHRVNNEGVEVIGATELGRIIGTLGIRAEPLHPGERDPSLACFFSINVPDGVEAQWIVAQLLATPGVESAYIKPPDEAPSSPFAQ
jgi:hypothetical protein